jgi:hypothetical protein
MGTPFRSTGLRWSTQAQATSATFLDHVLGDQSPPKRSSPLVALQNLLDFLGCLFSTSTPSNLYDSKDEGIDNENENMDKDYFDYNELLGTTMAYQGKRR